MRLYAVSASTMIADWECEAQGQMSQGDVEKGLNLKCILASASVVSQASKSTKPGAASLVMVHARAS